VFVAGRADWHTKCLREKNLPQRTTRKDALMWKPTNAPSASASSPGTKPNQEVEKPAMNPMSTSATASAEPTPAAAPRNATMNTNEQATIGKSLVFKGGIDIQKPNQKAANGDARPSGMHETTASPELAKAAAAARA